MTKKLTILLFFILAVAPQIEAQQNEVFKAKLTTAWDFHTQKNYDSAMTNYVRAFNNYSAPVLDNGILPEFKKVA